MTTSIPHPRTEEVLYTKYSTFLGVYVPALLAMFGVVLFLRMGWIVGSSGLFQSLAAITLTLLITFITALSIASIASNFSVNSASSGAYFMISNELGSGLGSAIGIPLYLAQTFTICFAIFGFTESLHYFFPWVPLQLIGLVTLVLLASIAYFALEWVMKMHLLIFGILALSLCCFFFGHPYPEDTVVASYRLESFWKIFGVFFPVAMGVECGISMAEHLKTPSRSILIGSVAATLTAFLIYVAVAVFLTRYAPREILQGDPFVIHKCSKFPGIIQVAIWLLAMMSGIGSLLSAPKTLQAIALDGIVFRSIGKEPKLAIGITLLIAFCSIYFSNLNVIAPLLTMVLLSTYGLINLATSFEEMMENPSWRPTFRMPWGLPFAGALLCFIPMFIIDSLTTLIVIAFSLSAYSLAKIFGIGNDKDDLRQSLLFFLSRSIIYKLADESLKVRSWRPNFLVFTRSPMRFSNLILFARELTRKHGFLTVASIFSTDQALKQKEKDWIRLIRKNLRANRTKALVEVVSAKDPIAGMKQIVETYGIGPLVPNTIILGQGFEGTHIDIIEFARREQRNILLFRDSEKEIARLPREVDIWWDEDQKNNAKFMLVLAFMLKRSPLFRSAKFTLKSVVDNENARSERELYFRKLLEESRIDIQSKVFLGTDFNTYANKEGLTFIGMRAMEEGESREDYEKYYKQQIVATKDLSMVIFALGFEQMQMI